MAKPSKVRVRILGCDVLKQPECINATTPAKLGVPSVKKAILRVSQLLHTDQCKGIIMGTALADWTGGGKKKSFICSIRDDDITARKALADDVKDFEELWGKHVSEGGPTESLEITTELPKDDLDQLVADYDE